MPNQPEHVKNTIEFLSELIKSLTSLAYYGEVTLSFRAGQCFKIVKRETLVKTEFLTLPGQTEKEEEPK